MRGQNLDRPLPQKVDFRRPEQQRLSAAFFVPLFPIDADLEGPFYGGQHFIRSVGLGAETAHHSSIYDVAGADDVLHAVDRAEGELVLRHPPVPLEALRGDARSEAPSERHPLGQAAVVAVQEGGRV